MHDDPRGSAPAAIFQMIEDYGSTVLIATPSYTLHMCEVGEKTGFDWASSSLRIGFRGEPCTPPAQA